MESSNSEMLVLLEEPEQPLGLPIQGHRLPERERDPLEREWTWGRALAKSWPAQRCCTRDSTRQDAGESATQGVPLGTQGRHIGHLTSSHYCALWRRSPCAAKKMPNARANNGHLVAGRTACPIGRTIPGSVTPRLRTLNYHSQLTASCNTSSEDIPEEQNRDVSTPQLHGSGIYTCKQPGRNSLQGIGRLSQVPMDVVPGKEYPHHSPAPTRGTEHNSQCEVLDYDRSIRLATESSHIWQDIQYVGSHRGGHVCLTSDINSVPSLFQPVPYAVATPSYRTGLRSRVMPTHLGI